MANSNILSDAKKVKTLSMYKEGKVQRNAEGKITKAASYQSREVPNARIEPNRKWFTNTRVVSQDTLNAFRDAMAEKANDPYQVLLKSNKLPMSLIRDGQDTNGLKQHKAKMAVESSPFSEVFGPKSQRKRVKLGVSNITDLADDTEKSMDSYRERVEQAKLLSGTSGDGEDGDEAPQTMAIEPVFDKGQSKRIWNELYKVIDSSDVVIHVLDARDPVGTRCRSIEKYLKEEAPHKHLIFVLNKCDLVPTSVAVSTSYLFLHPCYPFSPNALSQDAFFFYSSMGVCPLRRWEINRDLNCPWLMPWADWRRFGNDREMCWVFDELKSACTTHRSPDCSLLSDDTDICFSIAKDDTSG